MFQQIDYVPETLKKQKLFHPDLQLTDVTLGSKRL